MLFKGARTGTQKMVVPPQRPNDGYCQAGSEQAPAR
jgi:hypothetical protein